MNSTNVKVSRLSIEFLGKKVLTFNKRKYELRKLPLDSSFCAVTADSKSRWLHGKRAYFRGVSFWGNRKQSPVQAVNLRPVYTYDASTSMSHGQTGTTQAQEKGTRACACACVVPVHTWLMLVLMLVFASYVLTSLLGLDQPRVRGELSPTALFSSVRVYPPTGDQQAAQRGQAVRAPVLLWRHPVDGQSATPAVMPYGDRKLPPASGRMNASGLNCVWLPASCRMHASGRILLLFTFFICFCWFVCLIACSHVRQYSHIRLLITIWACRVVCAFVCFRLVCLFVCLLVCLLLSVLICIGSHLRLLLTISVCRVVCAFGYQTNRRLRFVCLLVRLFPYCCPYSSGSVVISVCWYHFGLSACLCVVECVHISCTWSEFWFSFGFPNQFLVPWLNDPVFFSLYSISLPCLLCLPVFFLVSFVVSWDRLRFWLGPLAFSFVVSRVLVFLQVLACIKLNEDDTTSSR